MMKFEPLAIYGSYLVYPKIFEDARGQFIKTFHADFFQGQGLETNFKEDYFAISKKNVLRGLHFQRPPHPQVKLVYCVTGEIYDVIFDCRQQSPSYGQSVGVYLSAGCAKAIYVPAGCAHGYVVLSDDTQVVYKGSALYVPELDGGIRWDSCAIKWPIEQPILSEKDKALPHWDKFDSPF